MNKLKKITALIILCILLIITQTGCGAKEPVSEEFFCLDTVCRITVYGQDRDDAKKIIADAFELCGYYENMFSKTIEASDVSKINKAEGKPVTVSDETLEVIKKGIEFGRLSGGKFDITIGAVSALWDFNAETPSVPDEADIRAAVKSVDYKQIKLYGNKVSMENKDAQLDLGGIAKGYIADRVADQMIEDGVGQAIINLGGNIVAIGEKEEKIPWTVGIERPYSDRTAIVGAVKVSNETVTTSGVYERCFTKDGKLYHHVLDPDTGYPIETESDAVTVQGPVGMSAESDAFGTMFLMIGEKAAAEILKEYPEMKAAFIGPEDSVSALAGMEILPVE